MNITTMAGSGAGGIINTTNQKKKSSQGRKKIEIKKIEQVNNRQVTFSKRRAGLFKKASELCILTGAQVAILVHSPGGRVYSFGHPTADILVDRYLATTTNPSNASTSARPTTQKQPPPVKEFNQHYVEVSKELEAENRRREVIQESKMVNGGGLPWYAEDVDGMEVEELQEYLSALGELKRRVLVRADELTMINKTPPLLGPNMLDTGDSGFTYDGPSTIIPVNHVAPAGFRFDFGY